MSLLRQLSLSLLTALYILGGLYLFNEWLDMKETIEAQKAVMVELARLSALPVVEAQVDRRTGNVAIRINKNDKAIQVLPGLCPRVFTL